MGAGRAVAASAATSMGRRRLTPSSPVPRGGYLTALLCTESPYQTIDREQHDSAVYDLTFTCDRAAVPLFKRSRAGSVYYLAHAYDPGVHQPGEPDPSKVCDVFFCGTRFPERTALLDGIDWTGIDLRDKSVRYDQHATLEEISAQVVPNTTAAAWYRSAKININHHRTIKHPKEAAEIGAGEAESLNPRAYEIAACGGFQVCDRSRPELFDVFGGSVPTYTDSASLEHLIRYYLTHTEEREALRQRQYQAVLHHSWKERAKEVLLVLERHRYQLA
jgi:spore maturation protein CgeB